MAGDVLVLVGTTKGAFLFRSDVSRRRFNISGPHLGGHEIASIALDRRNGHSRILAGSMSWHWGAGIVTSDDLGETWSDPAVRRVKFPEDTGAAIARVWQITPAGADHPNVVYAGVEPAALFKSTDSGETFSLVDGLWNHPHRPTWHPGGGGLCLHTIKPDPTEPNRMLVAISTGGVYRTEDGGKTWQARNAGIRADFLPDNPNPEYGQCVHKIARDPVEPSTLYLQNHGGLYRSEDGGDSWTDMANGVPSDFGFAMLAHPRKQGTAYIVPLAADMTRWTAEGKCRVYRTQDGGRSWQPLSNGLPQDHAYHVVLRDGLAADTLEPAGLYFGTRTGHLYGSADEGESWQLLADSLPPVLCVKAAVL
jgi:photosystem II stability/assembly factor-like uncharacterized protein